MSGRRVPWAAAALLLLAGLVLVPLAGATAPTVAITSGPNGPVASSSASFSFSVTDDTGTVAVECSLDGGGYVTCDSPGSQAYSGLGDGAHSFSVRATNADGSGSDSRAWSVDTTAPTTSITSAPPSPTSQTSANFTFSASEAATFECSLDGAGFGGCSSGVSYTGLGGGSHTFSVRATDALGNTGPTAGHTWTVDVTAPTTTITSGPSGTTGPNGNTFAFTASEPASFACRLDGAGFAACSSGVSYSGLDDGGHTFEVRATDTAGNVGAVASRAWTVDATPPETTITGGPAQGSTTSSATQTFTFSSSEPGSSFQCSLDGGGFGGCSSPATLSLADGSHTFAVRAIDAIGNADASPATRAFTVDTVGPTTTITSGPSGTVTSTSATFAFSASEDGSTFQCRIDGGAFSACASPRSYTGLGDGSHSFEARATDAAGNSGPAAAAAWTIDSTPPTTSLSGAPTGTVATAGATISFSASEPATFACSLDGAAFTGCASPVVLSGLADGAHTFRVRATDGAGNTTPSPATATWSVDTTPPTITTPGALTVEANGPGGSVTSYAVSAADDGTALLPGAISCAPASGSLFPIGETVVSCQAADALGNLGTAVFTVDVVDSTAPTLNALNGSFTATSAAGIRRDDPAMAAYLRGFTAFDLVGVVAVRSTAPELFLVGVTTILVTADDAAGNRAERTVVVTVLPLGSKAPPAIDQQPPPDVTRVRAVAGDHTVTLSWAAAQRDVAAVEIRMSVAGDQQRDRLVYRGLRSPQLVRRLRNDVEHRFVLVSVDAAGNRSRGVVVLATPKPLLLALPKPGARVTAAPLLRWAPVGGASYFNVQVYRGRVKVLSVWPAKARYKLKARWVYEKTKRSLVPGTYTWYVWPGLGARSEVRYGPLLGKSTFTYVKPRTSLAAKKAAAKKAAAKKAAAKKAAAKKAAAQRSSR